jgi:hypothetical protein
MYRLSMASLTITANENSPRLYPVCSHDIVQTRRHRSLRGGLPVGFKDLGTQINTALLIIDN